MRYKETKNSRQQVIEEMLWEQTQGDALFTIQSRSIFTSVAYDKKRIFKVYYTEKDFVIELNHADKNIESVKKLLFENLIYIKHELAFYGNKITFYVKDDHINPVLQLLIEQTLKTREKKKLPQDDLYKSNTSFEALLEMPSVRYKGIDITEEDLPVRAWNRLQSTGIKTIEKLLQADPVNLMSLPGFGKQSVDDIVKYLKKVKDATAQMPEEQREPISHTIFHVAGRMAEVISERLNKNLCPASRDDQKIIENNNETQHWIRQLAYEDQRINIDLMLDLLAESEKIPKIAQVCESIIQGISLQTNIRSALEKLPENIRNNQAHNYLALYNKSPQKLQTLKEIYEKEDDTLYSALHSKSITEENLSSLEEFLDVCAIRPQTILKDIFNEMKWPEKYPDVLKLRAEGKTLRETGDIYQVTRERIRQLEQKLLAQFARKERKHKLILRISADRNGDTVLTPKELAAYAGNRAAEFIYLLKNINSLDFIYSESMDLFLINSDGTEESRAQNYIESLPDSFEQNKLDYYAEAGAEETGLPTELIKAKIQNSYRVKGIFYAREEIKKSVIYEDILRSFYPNGIRIYDKQQMLDFRTHVIQKYGEIRMDSDRAIGARIADCGILCGKGVYKPKQDHYISTELENEIENFIRTSENIIIPFRYLYEQFEDELKREGVDNQYYLQGILGELFRDQFGFKKDYISAEKEIPSMHELIRSRIRKSKLPIGRTTILSEFPGINPFTIVAATDDPDILNYRASYIYKDNIHITYPEKWEIRNALKALVCDHEIHDSHEIYDLLSHDSHAVLRRNYVTDHFSCFSLLKYLFDEEFQFERPYISEFEVAIKRPMERLQEYAESRDQINLRELAAFVKENNVPNVFYLAFAKEHNDRFFLVSKEKMVAISKTGADEHTSQIIEELILPYVHETMEIRDLPCFTAFPEILVPWTDWLVYSILQKWGRKLSVGVSSNQLRLAVPLIAPRGQLDPTSKKYEVKDQENFSTDDLSNLDELLEDLIEWEDLDMDE